MARTPKPSREIREGMTDACARFIRKLEKDHGAFKEGEAALLGKAFAAGWQRCYGHLYRRGKIEA
ncbi:MAG: hypothetical protein ACF8XB_20955 [Planctomycetota bacterium JB042]